MADSLAVLSGSTCACPAGFCGITPWYRCKFQWSRGDLAPYGQLGNGEKVGNGFAESNSTKYITASWQDRESQSMGCCPGISGTNVTGGSYITYSYGKVLHATTTAHMRYTYAGNGVNGGYALIDVNLDKYIKANPTATTLSISQYLGTWYYIINNFTSPEFIFASGEDFWNHANHSWWVTNYCCWPGFVDGGWYCIGCEWNSYTVVRGGAAAQQYYGKTSWSTQEVLGSSTPATLYAAVAEYDKDPNTAGANIIAGSMDLTALTTVSSPTSGWPPLVTTIDLKTLNFTVA